jgi:hypothetical protein
MKLPVKLVCLYKLCRKAQNRRIRLCQFWMFRNIYCVQNTFWVINSYSYDLSDINYGLGTIMSLFVHILAHHYNILAKYPQFTVAKGLETWRVKFFQIIQLKTQGWDLICNSRTGVLSTISQTIFLVSSWSFFLVSQTESCIVAQTAMLGLNS